MFGLRDRLGPHLRCRPGGSRPRLETTLARTRGYHGPRATARALAPAAHLDRQCPQRGIGPESSLSETPAKKSVAEEVGEGASSEVAVADTQPNEKPAPSAPTPAPANPVNPANPASATRTPVATEESVDDSETEPARSSADSTARADAQDPVSKPRPDSEESSAPRVVQRPTPDLPRASPPRPRAPSSPAVPGRALGTAPKIAGTRTVKLPTPPSVAGRSSDDPPSTEPSLTDADGTAATKPFEVEDTTATLRNKGKPAERDEEDDGPTLIAERIVPTRDDEETLVQPMARQPEPHSD